MSRHVPATGSPPTSLSERLAWLTPLFLLGGIAGGVAVVRWHPAWLLASVLLGVVGAVLLWVFVSAFWPAKADHRCPRCGADAFERLDPATTQGLECRACGFRDEQATSWFHAEEEGGPLEEVVLLERRSRRAKA